MSTEDPGETMTVKTSWLQQTFSVKNSQTSCSLEDASFKIAGLTGSGQPLCTLDSLQFSSSRMANYPVSLGNSRITILVTDDEESEVAVMTIYTVHIYRESRPSLPMFGYHVMCSFVQVGAFLLAAGLQVG